MEENMVLVAVLRIENIDFDSLLVSHRRGGKGITHHMANSISYLHDNGREGMSYVRGTQQTDSTIQ